MVSSVTSEACSLDDEHPAISDAPTPTASTTAANFPTFLLIFIATYRLLEALLLDARSIKARVVQEGELRNISVA